MNRFLFTFFAVAVPLAAASYGLSPGYAPSPSAGYGAGPAGGASYLSSASSNGLDELVQAAAGGAQQTAAPNAEIQPTASEVARLSQVQAQLQALNANPAYRNLKNSDAIAESLAQSNLASNIRQGNINIVAPNVIDQGVFRSLLVPSGQNNHQVIATQPLPPIIVNQPGAPPTQIGGGPAAVVKAAPVIYKIKPSVIYQQEVINKVPTPLSLNPVYVKVYKPGKKVDAPLAPAVQQNYQASAYGGSGYGGSQAYGGSQSSYGGGQSSYGGGQSSYGGSQSSYGSQPAYASQPAYGSSSSYGAAPAPAPSDSYAPAPAPGGY